MAEITKYWRQPNPHDGSNMFKKIYKDVPATRIFDNCWFIGNDMYGAYIVRTSDGLIMLDCMEPGFFEYLEGRIVSAGLDPKELKAILITHGHFDHFGDANLFRDKYGAKLYMTERDAAFAQDPANGMPSGALLRWDMDGYLVPGEDFVLGDTRISIYSTPGHTPATASFLFTVYDNGKPLKFAMWGGTGPNKEVDMIKMQLRSAEYFDEVCQRENVVGELPNHPFADNLIEKLEVIRKLVDGVPHPLVIGKEGVHSMMMMYRDMYCACLEKRK